MKVAQSCLILCDPMDLVHAVLYVKYINKTECKNNEFFGEMFVKIVKVKSILRLTRCKLLLLQKFRWFKILFLINNIEDHCNCINGYLICTHYGNLFLEQSALLFLFHKYCCKTHLKKNLTNKFMTEQVVISTTDSDEGSHYLQTSHYLQALNKDTEFSLISINWLCSLSKIQCQELRVHNSWYKGALNFVRKRVV